MEAKELSIQVIWSRSIIKMQELRIAGNKVTYLVKLQSLESDQFSQMLNPAVFPRQHLSHGKVS